MYSGFYLFTIPPRLLHSTAILQMNRWSSIKDKICCFTTSYLATVMYLLAYTSSSRSFLGHTESSLIISKSLLKSVRVVLETGHEEALHVAAHVQHQGFSYKKCTLGLKSSLVYIHKSMANLANLDFWA